MSQNDKAAEGRAPLFDRLRNCAKIAAPKSVVLECTLLEAANALTASAEREKALTEEVARLREALQFYADGNHFAPVDKDAWESVSGEPENFLEDDANTVTVEDGSIAKAVLAALQTTGAPA